MRTAPGLVWSGLVWSGRRERGLTEWALLLWRVGLGWEEGAMRWGGNGVVDVVVDGVEVEVEGALVEGGRRGCGGVVREGMEGGREGGRDWGWRSRGAG